MVDLSAIDIENLNDILSTYVDTMYKEMNHCRNNNKNGQYNEKIEWYRGHIKYVKELSKKVSG